MVTQVLDTANDPTPVIATAATPTNKNPTTTPGATATAQPTPTKAKDPDAEVCSGRPFDAFMQLKNGSIYAFRGTAETSKTKKSLQYYFIPQLGLFFNNNRVPICQSKHFLDF